MNLWGKKTGCWMLALGLAATVGARRPEPNAYLNRPVRSAAELVMQAKNDPEVMDRYMRHFALGRREVLALLSSLHLAKIKRDTPMTVFNCSEQDGVIRQRLFSIKAGAWVFADASGRPVLKMTCGNPFWTRPPEAPEEVETATVPVTLRQDQVLASTETLPIAEVVEPPFEVPEPLAVPPVPHLELPGTEDVFTRPSRRAPLWPWLLGTFALDHPGGGRDFRKRKNDPPVPGPAGALAFGIPALAGALRRRRRSRQV